MSYDATSQLDSTRHVSKAALWSGRIVGGLPALFLIVDAAMKLAKPDFVVKPTVELGFSEGVIEPLGVVLLVSTLLYLIPRTSILGSVLLTGYLGGAVATHVLVGHGWFEILFPVAFGILLWGGLWFRDPSVRRVLPLRESQDRFSIAARESLPTESQRTSG